MKKSIFAILGVGAAMAVSLSACVGDLNVTPIDENIQLPEDVLNNQDAFKALLAKCYQGLCCSSSFGPDGGPDIDGVDGGYGQYMRAIVNLQEVSTDVVACCWNDGNLFDIHNMTWNSSNEFVLSMYYRIFYQIGLCNEFIRQSKATAIEGYTDRDAYIAEARALRLLSYYHAIDMFGNVPFTTEENSVGSTGPEQMMRADLFNWMVTEAQSLLDGSDLAAIGQNEYGRADKGLVQMILAKLYLNAEVWKGEAMYDKCAAACEEIIKAYPLHASWAELFMADNHLWTKNKTYAGDELIFVAPQDGLTLQSYGSTNFLVFASTWSVAGDDTRTMDAAADMGISSGWSGLSLTGTFTSKFADDDARATFFKGGFAQYIDQIRDDVGASNGWKSRKFRNVNHDGSAAQAAGFVDIDFPVFRSADAYLMYAECAARGGADKTKGQQYLNAVRTRAGMGELQLTLDNILDERARELYLEGHRRQDLVRFGLYTSGDYLWEFKGGEPAGKAVDAHFNLYPLTSGDTNANGNLKQNEGY
ncbi:MAG: RagB/SusD family nutrient uptake outer membrane protein [Bacteroidaceae bacterium]|nr:RagB/SusD family nutrient uptake outer membrane protein [Bacteroidaceae bacterium]